MFWMDVVTGARISSIYGRAFAYSLYAHVYSPVIHDYILILAKTDACYIGAGQIRGEES